MNKTQGRKSMKHEKGFRYYIFVDGMLWDSVLDWSCAVDVIKRIKGCITVVDTMFAD